MSKDSTTLTESGQQTINKIEYSEGTVEKFTLRPQARRKQRKTKAERDNLRSVSRYQSQDDNPKFFNQNSQVEPSFFEKKRKVLKEKQELLNRSYFSNHPKATSSTFTRVAKRTENFLSQHDVSSKTLTKQRKNLPEQGFVHELKQGARKKDDIQENALGKNVNGEPIEQSNVAYNDLLDYKGSCDKQNTIFDEHGAKEKEFSTEICQNKETSIRQSNFVSNHREDTEKNRLVGDCVDANQSQFEKVHKTFFGRDSCKYINSSVFCTIFGIIVVIAAVLTCYYGVKYFQLSQKEKHHFSHNDLIDHNKHNKTLTRQQFSKLLNEYNRLTNGHLVIPYQCISKRKLQEKFLKMSHFSVPRMKTSYRNKTQEPLIMTTRKGNALSTTTSTKNNTLTTRSMVTTTMTTVTTTTTPTTMTSTTTIPTTKTTSTVTAPITTTTKAAFNLNTFPSFQNQVVRSFPTSPVQIALQPQFPTFTGSEWIWNTQNSYKRGNIPNTQNDNQEQTLRTQLNPLSLDFNDPFPVQTTPSISKKPYSETIDDAIYNNKYLTRPSELSTTNPLYVEETGLRSPSDISDKSAEYTSTYGPQYISTLEQDLRSKYKHEYPMPIHDDKELYSSKIQEFNDGEHIQRNENNVESNWEYVNHHKHKKRRHHHHRRKKLGRYAHHHRHLKHHRRRLFRRRKTTKPPKSKESKINRTTTAPRIKTTQTTLSTTNPTTRTRLVKSTVPLTTVSGNKTTKKYAPNKKDFEEDHKREELRASQPHKLHWDHQHHRFPNNNELNEIFNTDDNLSGWKERKRKRARKNEREKERLSNDGDTVLGKQRLDGDFENREDYSDFSVHQSPLIVSGDGDDAAFGNWLRKNHENSKGIRKLIHKPNHFSHSSYRLVDGLEDYVDAIRSGHHFVEPMYNTLFQDAERKFFLKKYKHRRHKKRTFSKQKLKLQSVNNPEVIVRQPSKNQTENQDNYLKMIIALKKEIDQVKNKTQVIFPTPRLTTHASTTTITTSKAPTIKASTTKHRDRINATPQYIKTTLQRSTKQRQQRHRLMSLLRERMKRVKDKKSKRINAQQQNVVKTYKVKNCIIIKKFKPSIKIAITSGPEDEGDGRIVYTVKACKRGRKNICRNIHYRISSGELHIKKRTVNGVNIFMVVVCKKPFKTEDELNNLATLDDGKELKEASDANEQQKHEVISKYSRSSGRRHLKKPPHHTQRNHYKRKRMRTKCKGKSTCKDSHGHPTHKAQTEKSTEKKQISGLLSIIKDMQKEMKRQSGHKLDEKDLVKKMKKIVDEKLKNSKRKSNPPHKRKSKNTTKYLDSENLLFSEEQPKGVSPTSVFTKPVEIYEDMKQDTQTMGNEDVRSKTIEDSLQRVDINPTRSLYSIDESKSQDVVDGVNRLPTTSSYHTDNHEWKTFPEIGSSYKTMDENWDQPVDVKIGVRDHSNNRDNSIRHDQVRGHIPRKISYGDDFAGFMEKFHHNKNEINIEKDKEKLQNEPSVYDDGEITDPLNINEIGEYNDGSDDDITNQKYRFSHKDNVYRMRHKSNQKKKFKNSHSRSFETRIKNHHDGDRNYHWHRHRGGKRPKRIHNHHRSNRHNKLHSHHKSNRHKLHHHHGRNKHHRSGIKNLDNYQGEDEESEDEDDVNDERESRHNDYPDDFSDKKQHKKHDRSGRKHKSSKRRQHVKKKDQDERNNLAEDGGDEDKKNDDKSISIKDQDRAIKSADTSNTSSNQNSSRADEIETVVAKMIPAIVQTVQRQNIESIEKRSRIPTVRPSLIPTKHVTTILVRHSATPRSTKHRTTHPTHTIMKESRSTQANINMIIKGLQALGINTNQIKKKAKSPTVKAVLKPATTVKPQVPKKFHLHDPSKMRVLCFGDSLTAGYNAHGKNFFPYCSRLQDILNYRSNIPVFTETKGVVGEMTHKQMTNRLPLVLGNTSTQYDWVIILGGTNDILHVKNFADDQEFLNQLETVWQPRITKDIEKLHHIANNAGARTMLLTVPENSIEAWPEYKPLMKMRKLINDALRKFAAQSNGKTVLCDIAKKLPRHSLSPAQEARLWDDHLHMTPEGYTKMAGTVADCMRPFLQHPAGST